MAADSTPLPWGPPINHEISVTTIQKIARLNINNAVKKMSYPPVAASNNAHSHLSRSPQKGQTH